VLFLRVSGNRPFPRADALGRAVTDFRATIGSSAVNLHKLGKVDVVAERILDGLQVGAMPVSGVSGGIMPAYSIVGMFCEDIRQDVTRAETLVGVFPDNVSTPGLPLIIPKFGMYVRINLDPHAKDVPIEFILEHPDGALITKNLIDPKLISDTKAEARKTGAPIAGIISRVIMVSFEIHMPGRIMLRARVGKDEFVAGSLNVKVEPQQATTGATARRAPP
jgi:hypothetical protein